MIYLCSFIYNGTYFDYFVKNHYLYEAMNMHVRKYDISTYHICSDYVEIYDNAQEYKSLITKRYMIIPQVGDIYEKQIVAFIFNKLLKNI